MDIQTRDICVHGTYDATTTSSSNANKVSSSLEHMQNQRHTHVDFMHVIIWHCVDCGKSLHNLNIYKLARTPAIPLMLLLEQQPFPISIRRKSTAGTYELCCCAVLPSEIQSDTRWKKFSDVVTLLQPLPTTTIRTNHFNYWVGRQNLDGTSNVCHKISHWILNDRWCEKYIPQL